MKKIITTSIILISLIFSTLNTALALENWNTEWIIESLLNLPYWPEIDRLEDIKITKYNFKWENYIDLTNVMIKYDRKLKDLIIENYQNWNFSYTKMNWIITEYDFFVDRLNKYFERTRKTEKYSYLKKDAEVKKIISESYTQMRTHMNRIKYLIYEQSN